MGGERVKVGWGGVGGVGVQCETEREREGGLTGLVVCVSGQGRNRCGWPLQSAMFVFFQTAITQKYMYYSQQSPGVLKTKSTTSNDRCMHTISTCIPVGGNYRRQRCMS